MKAEVFLKAQAMLGEGPLWDDRRGCLFFVDIEGNLQDAGVKNALRGIGAEAQNFKILGNY